MQVASASASALLQECLGSLKFATSSASALETLKSGGKSSLILACIARFCSTRTASGGTGEPRGAGGGGQSGQRAFFTRPPFVGGDGQGG